MAKIRKVELDNLRTLLMSGGGNFAQYYTFLLAKHDCTVLTHTIDMNTGNIIVKTQRQAI